MSALHMVEMHLDMPALMRFARDQGLLHPAADDDLGYLVHAWLRAAFGDEAPGPWRLLLGGRRPTRILAYSAVDAVRLRGRMADFADPGVLEVCVPDDLRSKEMPLWQVGRRLGFEALCCPVVREGATGTEKDAFLHELPSERVGAPLRREDAYGAWARTRLEHYSGVSVGRVGVHGFRLVRMLRRPRPTGRERRVAVIVRPQVLVRGDLTVLDPGALSELLTHGIGRHRTFGYGMVLLRPPGQ